MIFKARYNYFLDDLIISKRPKYIPLGYVHSIHLTIVDLTEFLWSHDLFPIFKM